MATDQHGNGSVSIPDVVVRRLPLYLRALRELERAGMTSVSSEDLAREMGVTAAQVRRDLSFFGRFGKQGTGYDTAFLADRISGILRLDEQWDVALAGLGNLGRAIADYRGFLPASFRLAAIFDRNPARVGQEVAGVIVLPPERIADEVARLGIRIGVLAVPQGAAQSVADAMVEGGVRAIVNYAPARLRVPDRVTVRDIDPIGALQSVTWYLDG